MTVELSGQLHGRLIRSPLLPIALIVYSAALFAYGAFAIPRETLKSILIVLEPWVLDIHALLIAAFSLMVLRRCLRGWTAHARLLAALVLLVGIQTSIALWIHPRTHRLYFDEDIYTQVGLSIAHEARSGMIEVAVPDSGVRKWKGAEYSLNKEPAGYSYLVSITERLFGAGHDAGIWTTLIFFGLGTVGVGLLARAFQPGDSPGRDAVAILAAGAYALWPENLRWSVSAATEITATSLAIWSMLLTRRARESGDAADAGLAALILAMAVQQRPEGLMMLAPCALLALPSCRPGDWPWRRILFLASALVVLILPHFLHMASMSGESWGASGPKFSWSYVAENFRKNVEYWYCGRRIQNTEPAVWMMFPLAVIGLIGAIVGGMKGRWREPAALALWLGLFFGIFIPFYAGSYYYGVDVRFSLLVVPPYLIFAAIGVESMCAGLAKLHRHLAPLARLAVAVAVAVSAAPQIMGLAAIGPEAAQARTDHAAVELFVRKLPANAVVVSHLPSLWLVHGVPAVQVNWANRHRAGVDALLDQHAVFYHYSYWDIGGRMKTADRIWQGAGRDFMAPRDSELIDRVEYENEWIFALYRVKM